MWTKFVLYRCSGVPPLGTMPARNWESIWKVWHCVSFCLVVYTTAIFLLSECRSKGLCPRAALRRWRTMEGFPYTVFQGLGLVWATQLDAQGIMAWSSRVMKLQIHFTDISGCSGCSGLYEIDGITSTSNLSWGIASSHKSTQDTHSKFLY